MTTSELVSLMSIDQGITRAQSEAYLDSILMYIKKALAVGDEVKLDRFGKFVSTLHRKKVQRGTNEQVSTTGIEVSFQQYVTGQEELVRLSKIGRFIKQEVEYVLAEDSNRGCPQQRDERPEPQDGQSWGNYRQGTDFGYAEGSGD